MQSAKPTNHYKFSHFDVQMTVFNQQKVSLTISDSIERMEFQEKQLVLRNIGSSTLMRAFESSQIEIKMDINVKKSPESVVLLIDVLVSSQFLKPMEQSLTLKKKRDISESEILKNALDNLSSKLKVIQNNDKETPNSLHCSISCLDEKVYNTSNNYEQMGSIKLPKGKFLLTISFLLKANNSWLYVYMNNGQVNVLQNCGFYVSTSSYFMPHTLRKVHQTKSDNEVVTIQTYYAQSYPVTIKNFIISAKQIQ